MPLLIVIFLFMLAPGRVLRALVICLLVMWLAAQLLMR
jgi:hypothetical protein